MRYFLGVFVLMTGLGTGAPAESIETLRLGLSDFQPLVIEEFRALARPIEHDPLATRVDVHVRYAPLNEFLAIIVGQTKVVFWIPAEIVNRGIRVTADINGVPARDALSEVLEPKGLTYSRRGGDRRYVVMDDPLAVLVDLSVADAPLAVFLDAVSKQTRVRFIIEEGVQAKPVTARFVNVTARSAVKMVAGAQGLELGYAEDSETYFIRARGEFAARGVEFSGRWRNW